VASLSIPFKHLELKSVLVATDMTESSDKALEHGIAIARHYGATLYVAYVVSSMGFTLAGPEAVQCAVEVSRRDIDSLVAQLFVSGKLFGIEVQPVVLQGNVDTEMDSFVRAHQIDLIVVGTHGRRGMSRLFFGSTAQLIAKCCCCPVLTVGPHASGPWLGNPADLEKPLLFATAFNSASTNAMPYAVALANDFDRQMFLLHVTPPHRAPLLGKESDEEEASAIAHLSALLSPYTTLKCASTTLVKSCDPAVGILRAAKRIHAVTIVMGAHRDSFSDLAIRHPWSIVNQVNREATCPVLTVRG
jgi:nucleotide-binding universal stress UspA family protein